ncbi:hypothetical protein BDY17DRAFT_292982 [Neohortaea acidophila]|uniref:Glycosyl transferase CAP10 domain-containing protein n=1 Tax=Neohortaea acidophila TaxID=245834 RepID=A0A6A6Q129_9PEZI|nr:uncharacterized protein BDY17DRAFT_292982 [Neohortaea acidophila]KAF2485127.1 hypothetical protein BDY17DRAFT_292982 [Neohortaea acidophila]
MGFKTPLSNRFAQLLILAACLILAIWLLAPTTRLTPHIDLPTGISWSRPKPVDAEAASGPPDVSPTVHHPIDTLIQSATLEFNSLLSKETLTLHEAAEAYRKRRGRQPPPLFDKWFEFAQNSSAVIVEDFFDRIYHDLNPFWGMPAKEIREIAHTFKGRISIRDGAVNWWTANQQPEWLRQWSKMITPFASNLPDVDMPINEMDESRMVVEWATINEHMKRAEKTKRMVSQAELKNKYQSLSYLDANPPAPYDPKFARTGLYWEKAVVGCAPGSPARKMKLDTDFASPPHFAGKYPPASYEGYVRNWTLTMSPCDNPHLQALHGTFIEPLSMQHTRQFWPLFGGSKLPMNNEILLPAAMYWTDDPFYSGGQDHGEAWRLKKDKLVWRGAASGGRNKADNWRRFQRHRFVSMVNGTTVREAELNADEPPQNFVLPAKNSYRLAAMASDSKPGDLGEWIGSWSDAAFVHLLCFPKPPPEHKRMCEYTDPYFHVVDRLAMADQYDFKYLPDIDGNSFSGRYRGFVGSTSLPIKATIYQEWHDSRLVPWKHFVPMDNTFIDIYGIMEYFIGNHGAGVAGHDNEAREIALGGKKWAERVLRHEDMQIYVFRLLLEYARLCDDDREVMGWKE